MPTVRGWGLLGAGVALVVLWYYLGDPELFLVGIFFAIATLLASLYVHFVPTGVVVGRRIPSGSIHSGDTISIELTLQVPHRTVRNLRLVDSVGGLGHAAFEVAAIRPGDKANAAYKVTCRPRGVYRVGPSTGVVTDPLGLAERRIPKGTVDRLVVYPYIEDLRFPLHRGTRAPIDARRQEHLHRGGEDFNTLREYQIGDDLRRIHWPSFARTDQVMIRQLDEPWQSRSMVVLDTRAELYESDNAFETAVSGAASMITYLVSKGQPTDLWTTESAVVDASHYSSAMERLSAIGHHEEVDIASAAAEVRGRGGGGPLVIVTGAADRDLLNVTSMMSPDYAQTLVMVVASSTPQTIVGFNRLGAMTIQVQPGAAWAHAWEAGMRTSWETVSVR